MVAVANIDRDLRLDGNTPAQQGVKKDHLRMRVLRLATKLQQAGTKRVRPPPSRVAESVSDRQQFIGRDEPAVEQLLNDRTMVERLQVGGEIECQPGPGCDGDAVGPNEAITRSKLRRLAKSDPLHLVQMNAVLNREVQCRGRRLPAQTGEHCRGRSGHETAGVQRAQQAQTVLERWAIRGHDVHASGVASEHPDGAQPIYRLAAETEAPELRSRRDSVMVAQPASSGR